MALVECFPEPMDVLGDGHRWASLDEPSARLGRDDHGARLRRWRGSRTSRWTPPTRPRCWRATSVPVARLGRSHGRRLGGHAEDVRRAPADDRGREAPASAAEGRDLPGLRVRRAPLRSSGPITSGREGDARLRGEAVPRDARYVARVRHRPRCSSRWERQPSCSEGGGYPLYVLIDEVVDGYLTRRRADFEDDGRRLSRTRCSPTSPTPRSPPHRPAATCSGSSATWCGSGVVMPLRRGRPHPGAAGDRRRRRSRRTTATWWTM